MNLLDNPQLFDLSIRGNGDTGSASSVWLQTFNYQYPDCKTIRYSNKQFSNQDFYFIKHLWSCSWDDTETPQNIKNSVIMDFIRNDPRNTHDGKYFCEIYDNKFFHYRAGTNWMNQNKELHFSNLQKLLNVKNQY